MFESGTLAQFKEDGAVINVKILENNSTKAKLSYKLEVLEQIHPPWHKMKNLEKPGTIFDIYQKLDGSYFPQGWQLLKENTYVKVKK